MPKKDNSETVTIKATSLSVERARQVGAERVALGAAKLLGLSTVFKAQGFDQQEAKLALAAVAIRMVCPNGAPQIPNWFNRQSALEEFLELELTSLAPLKKISERLYKNKNNIELEINKNISNLFPDQASPAYFLITLGTLVAKENPENSFDQWYEPRAEYRKYFLGLCLDANGFIVRSATIPAGFSNQNELETLAQKLAFNNRDRLVITKNVATKGNVNWLKNNDFSYLLLKNKLLTAVSQDNPLDINSDTTAMDIWNQYSKLNELNTIFNNLNTDLGSWFLDDIDIPRMEYQIFITLLAYQCVKIIRIILKSSNINESWEKIRKSFDSQKRLTLIFQTSTGKTETICQDTVPNDFQAAVYGALDNWRAQ